LITTVEKRNMRRIIFGLSILLIFVLSYSCDDSGKKSGNDSKNGKIEQKDDGTLDLDLQKAELYSDAANPSSNTAEWNIVVSKPGRYKVWLSSATIDTMNLQYDSSVKISLQDERLDVQPVGDKIVLNSSDIKYPYFRADSFMGTFYIQDAGEYNLQVISEKVLPPSSRGNETETLNPTKLMSVFLVPVTR
jgi:hypothetical protein